MSDRAWGMELRRIMYAFKRKVRGQNNLVAMAHTKERRIVAEAYPQSTAPGRDGAAQPANELEFALEYLAWHDSEAVSRSSPSLVIRVTAPSSNLGNKIRGLVPQG